MMSHGLSPEESENLILNINHNREIYRLLKKRGQVIDKTNVIHPHLDFRRELTNGEIGIRLLINTPAAEAIEPMEMAAAMSWANSTIHTAQWRGPGILSNMSIIPSPVHTV